jgi:uncharacterized protein involved in exopolysaccharide biosynthesis
MSVASQLTDPEFDLPALGVALWRRKWAIIGPTILVALVTLGVVQIIPPKYQSEARLLIEQRGNIFLRPDADKDISDRGTVDQEAVTSQVQLVLSRDLASEVIAKLKLNERPEFDPMLAGLSPVKDLLGALGLIKDPRRMTPEERVLESYYDRLSVFAIEKSRVIVIDFLSEDPNLAARVANAIADAYLVRQRGAKREEAQAAGSASPTPRPRSRTSAAKPICSSAPTIPRCRPSSSATSVRRSPLRARRSPTRRRGRSSFATCCARASRSNHPTSSIPSSFADCRSSA